MASAEERITRKQRIGGARERRVVNEAREGEIFVDGSEVKE